MTTRERGNPEGLISPRMWNEISVRPSSGQKIPRTLADVLSGLRTGSLVVVPASWLKQRLKCHA
jgi:hypothetical protein